MSRPIAIAAGLAVGATIIALALADPHLAGLSISFIVACVLR